MGEGVVSPGESAGSRSFPRLVIGAPAGRSGKTTFTLGLAAALAARGLVVQPFKKGPDYIDPSWLTAAAGRPCRSLDPFFMPTAETLRAAFVKGASSPAVDYLVRGSTPPAAPSSSTAASISIIEGNHGLYDSSLGGEQGEEGAGSTAALARTLAAPVLLVVSVQRMARSAAALVRGYQTFEPDTPIRAVLLNHVARGRHEDKIRQEIERHCGLPVIGALPRDASVEIPDRHLGLYPQGENERHQDAIAACQAAVERYCDLQMSIRIAREATPFETAPESERGAREGEESQRRVRIGVFYDRAFSFYYYENLEALVEAGADIVPIDALNDPLLPEVDALYLGGGFPEVFMAELSGNTGLRGAVRRAADEGMPIYAECGGLIYLSRSLRWGNKHAEMAGVLPVDVEMTDRPQGHGYVQAQITGDNPFFPNAAIVRGHEFHNSRLVTVPPNLHLCYELSRGHGIAGSRDGIVQGNVLASYMHLHAAGAPSWSLSFVRKVRGAR